MDAELSASGTCVRVSVRGGALVCGADQGIPDWLIYILVHLWESLWEHTTATSEWAFTLSQSTSLWAAFLCLLILLTVFSGGKGRRCGVIWFHYLIPHCL